MNSKMQRILPLFGLAVIALAAWWFLAGQGNGDAGVVTASGFIEAEQVVISPEIGGRVRQVNAVEGQEVKAGEVLVEIDTAALTAQRTQAAAALEAAQAGAEAEAPGRHESAPGDQQFHRGEEEEIFRRRGHVFGSRRIPGQAGHWRSNRRAVDRRDAVHRLRQLRKGLRRQP